MKPILSVLLCLVLWGCKSSPESTRSLKSYSESDLYYELQVRQGVRDSSMQVINVRADMEDFSSEQLYEALRAIYGEDDRHNYYEAILTPGVKSSCEKVACLIEKRQLKKNTNGTYRLTWSQTYGQAHRLCGSEAFGEEPSISFGSGFAVSPKLFVTAGHCVNAANAANVLIVYGYLKADASQRNFMIQPEDIYNIEEIVDSSLRNGNDFCVIRIKGQFPPKRIATLRRSGTVKDSDSFYVIGHPGKLPLKVALNAFVLENNNPLSFKINSDTYEGNSGSPVFNAATHLVEGIIVSGERDFNFLPLESCKVSLRCPEKQSQCSGETVSRNSQFLNLIP